MRARTPGAEKKFVLLWGENFVGEKSLITFLKLSFVAGRQQNKREKEARVFIFPRAVATPVSRIVVVVRRSSFV
jgi:hypothetical protein